jgi:hypothetical protein
MSFREYAMDEFKYAGWLNEDGSFKDAMQEALCENILKILDIFAEEGHSGSSASYAIGLLTKLLKFEPLGPLTGEDWEWTYVSDGLYQNKRCSQVFKEDGNVYDSIGKVFYTWETRELGEDEEGYPGISQYMSHYTTRDSRVPVVFPYIPKIEYVEVANEL